MYLSLRWSWKIKDIQTEIHEPILIFYTNSEVSIVFINCNEHLLYFWLIGYCCFEELECTCLREASRIESEADQSISEVLLVKLRLNWLLRYRITGRIIGLYVIVVAVCIGLQYSSISTILLHEWCLNDLITVYESISLDSWLVYIKHLSEGTR